MIESIEVDQDSIMLGKRWYHDLLMALYDLCTEFEWFDFCTLIYEIWLLFELCTQKLLSKLPNEQLECDNSATQSNIMAGHYEYK